MKLQLFRAAVISLIMMVYGQVGAAMPSNDILNRSIEVFPIETIAGIYSVQYGYKLTPKDQVIVGLAYFNPRVYDNGVEIGQYFAPTLPIGYRRYILSNTYVEYQLWPAYDFYYAKNEDKFYNGFDLYSELRAGYSFDLHYGQFPLQLTAQYVYGIGLYPGNKPESFLKLAKESKPFQAPSVSLGMKF